MSLPPNTNLRRWCLATFLEHFKGVFVNNKYPYIQGQFQDGNAGDNPDTLERIELRIDGPWTQSQHIYEKHGFEVNILVITSKEARDVFKHDERVDTVRQLFTDCLPLYKIEKGLNSPWEVVGTLYAEKSKRRPMQVKNFGQIDPNVPILQSTVEGRYFLEYARNG